MILIPPERFWGHPDDWSDEAFDEHDRLVASKRLRDRFLCWLWGWR